MDLLVQAELLQNTMIARATGHDGSNMEYMQLRAALMNEPSIQPYIPHMVKTCRDLDQFWIAMKRLTESYSSGIYQARKVYIWEEFNPLLSRLENAGSPSDDSVSETLEKFDSEHIQAAWARALDRRIENPEGAITLAKSLVESVCKHILDHAGDPDSYSKRDDLPALYRKTAKTLGLSPDQHTEEAFKKILGGCAQVVVGLGELRNRVGDAHGQGLRPVKPLPRHAQLAVNLAGSMSAFLIATWEARQGSSQ